jgi:hypothetical protein
VPFEDRREQAGAGEDLADRVVLGDMAEPDRTEVATWGQAARSLENSIAPKSGPAGRVTFRCVTLR